MSVHTCFGTGKGWSSHTIYFETLTIITLLQEFFYCSMHIWPRKILLNTGECFMEPKMPSNRGCMVVYHNLWD